MSWVAWCWQVNEIPFYSFLPSWSCERSLSCPLGIWYFHLRERKFRRMLFKPLAPLDTSRQMAKWACLCVVLHSFVSCLLSFNEMLAALDKWRFGHSKGPCVDLLFLKGIFAWLETTKSLFVHFVSLAAVHSLSWICEWCVLMTLSLLRC